MVETTTSEKQKLKAELDRLKAIKKEQEEIMSLKAEVSELKGKNPTQTVGTGVLAMLTSHEYRYALLLLGFIAGWMLHAVIF